MTERTVSDKCFYVVDTWLYIVEAFAQIEGEVRTGEHREDVTQDSIGHLGIAIENAKYKKVISDEEANVAEYHLAQIRKLKHGDSIRPIRDAVTWAGRTFADKIVACECNPCDTT